MSAAELAGRRVLVVGLARSGKAAAEALVGRGAGVVGFDRDEELEVGRLLDLGVEIHRGHEEERLLQGIDLVVKSPGVPGETLLVASARERAVPVWGEIELGVAAPLQPDPRRHGDERQDDHERAPRRGLPCCRGGRSRSPATSVGR